jgi:hypothetical protein
VSSASGSVNIADNFMRYSRRQEEASDLLGLEAFLAERDGH